MHVLANRMPTLKTRGPQNEQEIYQFFFYIFLGRAKISNGYPCSQPPKEPLTIKSQVK